MSLDLYFAPVLHLVGYVTASAIYGLLLLMVWRAGWSRASRLPFAAGSLGLIWNVVSLAIAGHELGLSEGAEWLDGLGYAALGFLPAVVVHSILKDQTGVRGRAVTLAAYSVSAAAAIGHFVWVFRLGAAPWPLAAHWLGPVYGLFILPLVLLTGSQSIGRRAFWMAALAVFALFGSEIAYHSEGSLMLDLVGHHASMPLAFVILYQEYRFALGGRFLKIAIATIALVSVAMTAYVTVVARVGSSLTETPVVAAVLLLWILTALGYPALLRRVSRIVDRWLLGRDGFGRLRTEIASELSRAETSAEALNLAGERLAASLHAKVRWVLLQDRLALGPECVETLGGDPAAWFAQTLASPTREDTVWRSPRGTTAAVLVPCAEFPRPCWLVTDLPEGRRIGSDDMAVLEWAAQYVARAVDRLRIVHERYEHELREQELDTLRTEAELRALRSQLNPHFLFNALTTLGHLIRVSPERATDTLLNLTELLRRVLRSTGEWTTLGEELALVSSYLDIERARFEERLVIEMDVEPALHSLRLPPLILQPLVENAIKHGVAPKRSGGLVRVEARLDGEVLCLRVSDRGQRADETPSGASAESGPGVGLENVRGRLARYFGERASLSLHGPAGGGTEVTIRLPTVSGAGDARRPEPVGISR